MKYLGIDWARDVHYVALLSSAGEVLDEWTVTHDAASVEALLARMRKEGGPQEMRVGVESGAPLVVDQLLEAGYTVYAINPKQADRFRDRHNPAGSKDDRRDALVLADAIRTDGERLTPIERDDPRTEELRLRDRARSRLVTQRTRYGNQLTQVLGRYFPAVLSLDRVAHDAFLLALLREYPDPAAARSARRSKLERLLREHCIRVVDADRLVEVLRGPSFVVPEPVVAACRDEMRQLVEQIALLNRQIDEADRRLAALFEGHPDRELLRSLPGLGETLAIRVRAELGDRRARAPDGIDLQIYAGTAPVTRRSGRRGIQSISMRRGCNRVLQAALFHMARCSMARSLWARAYYEHARKHGASQAVAARALANKWAKILAAVLRTRKPYDETLHLDHLHRNGVPWIAATMREIERAA